MFISRKKRRYYLDYAAATPVSVRTQKVMNPYWGQMFANPQSIHSAGQSSALVVSQVRESIKSLVQSRKNDDIIFTSGGTESNQLALRTACFAWMKAYPNTSGVIVLSVLEHGSELAEATRMKQFGFQVLIIPVDENGVLRINFLDQILDNEEHVVFVGVVAQSSEVGTNQPLRQIGSLLRGYKKDSWPLFHVDHSQGLYYGIPHVQNIGVDTMTLCSQKFGGPKGIGVLYVSHQSPIVIEREGTPAVPLIVGMNHALQEISGAESGAVKQNIRTILALRSYFFEELDRQGVHYEINGLRESISLIANISFPDCVFDSEQLIIALDKAGIEVSSQSACMGSQKAQSKVLLAMNKQVHNSIRFSLHHAYVKRKDITRVVSLIKQVVR